MKRLLISIVCLAATYGCVTKTTPESPVEIQAEAVVLESQEGAVATLNTELDNITSEDVPSEVGTSSLDDPTRDDVKKDDPENKAVENNARNESVRALDPNASILEAFQIPCPPGKEHCWRDMLNAPKFDAMVEAGVNVNAKDKNGRTPLMVTDSADVVNALIQAGADVNAKDNEGNTALMRFAKSPCFTDEYETPELCRITEKYKQYVSDDEGSDGIYKPCAATCAELLVKAGADVKAVNNKGQTALMQIRNFGENIRDFDNDTESFVNVLIKAGAKVNAKDKDGNTPIMYANDPATIALLLKAGANVNAKNNLGQTALFYQYHPEVVKMLIKAGINVNAKDKEGQTALSRLLIDFQDAMAIDTETLSALIAGGANVNGKDSHGRTELMRIFCAGSIWNTDVIELIIKAGAKINATDNKGRTVLMYALQNDSVDSSVVETLIKAGANVKAKDKKGESVIQYTDDSEMIRLLINAGAKRPAPKKSESFRSVYHGVCGESNKESDLDDDTEERNVEYLLL